MTWKRREHTVTPGGNLLISNANSSGQQMVRGITSGFNTDFDPAAGHVHDRELPGRLQRTADDAAREPMPC